ncbi:p13 [Piscine orthoreovirus 2]|nr:p13 [Piscine orthoreovirus 2]
MMINTTSHMNGYLVLPSMSGSVPLEYVFNAGIALVCLIVLSLLWSLINAMASRCGIILHPEIGHGMSGVISSLAVLIPFLPTPTHTSRCSPTSGPTPTPGAATTAKTDVESLKLSDALETV